MKSRKLRVVSSLLMLLVIGGLITANYVLAKDDIIVFKLGTMNKHNPPYQYGNKPYTGKEEKPGISIEYMQLVEKRMNELLHPRKFKINYGTYPWKRLMISMKSGVLDAILAASFKQDRLQYGLYPMKDGKPDEARRMETHAYAFYSHKNNPVIWDGVKLTNLKGSVSVPRGYSIIAVLDKLNIPYETSSGTPNDFEKLVIGRSNAICALEDMGAAILRSDSKKYENIVKVMPALKSKAYYMMMSKQFFLKDRVLAELIWYAVADVRESEDLKEIRAQYLNAAK